MIRNEEELARARQRLELIKDELALLRHNVLRENRRTHDLMCEYFVKRIDEVQAEIDAYLASRGKAPTEDEERYHDRLESAYGDRGQA
jgi:hypothetical protein